MLLSTYYVAGTIIQTLYKLSDLIWTNNSINPALLLSSSFKRWGIWCAERYRQDNLASIYVLNHYVKLYPHGLVEGVTFTLGLWGHVQVMVWTILQKDYSGNNG